MDSVAGNNKKFHNVCVNECKGICCDPWWGFISYGVVKRHGLGGIRDFKSELIAGIKARAKRISDAYVTREEPPRPLFSSPERFSLSITGISIDNTTITANLLLGLAFRCAFFSKKDLCSIHPMQTGGLEIRPPQCGSTGSVGQKPGDKGFCRIVYATVAGNDISEAISAEKEAVERLYSGGFDRPEDAADDVIEGIRRYCGKHAPALAGLAGGAGATQPKNSPCSCGSGLKYKRCHGR